MVPLKRWFYKPKALRNGQQSPQIAAKHPKLPLKPPIDHRTENEWRDHKIIFEVHIQTFDYFVNLRLVFDLNKTMVLIFSHRLVVKNVHVSVFLTNKAPAVVCQSPVLRRIDFKELVFSPILIENKLRVPYFPMNDKVIHSVSLKSSNALSHLVRVDHLILYHLLSFFALLEMRFVVNRADSTFASILNSNSLYFLSELAT